MGIVKSQQVYLFQIKSHMNSSCILGWQIFFYFNFWTQWRWVGQDLSDAFYGVHQTRDSSSVNYDGFGFHSGGVSKTGVFTHRSVNVIRFAVSYCNDVAVCPGAINLDQGFRKVVNVDPGLIFINVSAIKNVFHCLCFCVIWDNFKLKTGGQKIYTENVTENLHNLKCT